MESSKLIEIYGKYLVIELLLCTKPSNTTDWYITELQKITNEVAEFFLPIFMSLA